MNWLDAEEYSQLIQLHSLGSSFKNQKVMSKVYYSHTTKLEVTKLGLVPACTIALTKRGEKFIYGVSICSKYDNFSKKYGREVAENRMEQEFGTLDVPKILNGLSEKEACLQQLYNLVTSVVTKNKKWKKKITKFNMQNKQGVTAKVVSMTSTKPVA